MNTLPKSQLLRLIEDAGVLARRIVSRFSTRYSRNHHLRTCFRALFDHTGTFNDVLEGTWECSEDGVSWEVDFNMTYTRVGV